MEREETVDDIVAKLEKVKHPVRDNIYYYCYQGFWVNEFHLKGIKSFQTQFVAREDDIVLASCPKSGTTWLKSLVFAIVKRNSIKNDSHLFTSSNPHDLIPFDMNEKFMSIIENMKPRLMATHIPYPSLPISIINYSNSKIVYICRNPLDLFVSDWYFNHKVLFGDDLGHEPSHLEEYFDMFCKGIHVFGPFWDHILGYWKASLEIPHKILFLKYEDLKKDNIFFIRKIADFLGFPFSVEEENQRVPQEIEKWCSFEHLRNLEVNKIGKRPSGASNSSFFRKGEIGDWANCLTPQMAERGKKLIQHKFGQYNLTFDV
ncbi:cytosolic sulfotransferase 15-like [Cannabis sativa]|uniref:cytosolic sulfotransferase 15-like n=1 Tax=Cannabis sativa TaxID=3483 RepID=UPI0011DF049B|nr:cytosolic sulfotransferase 15-like [Cannabis sativa]